MGKWAFLKYVLNERATMNPSTWLLAESMVHSMELCYAPTPLSFGSTARKVQKPFQVAPLRILPWPSYQTLSLNFNFYQTQVQSLSCLLSQKLCYALQNRLKFAQDFSKLLRGIVQVVAWIWQAFGSSNNMYLSNFTCMFCLQPNKTELKFDQDSKAYWSVCFCYLTKKNLHILNLGLNPGIFRSVFCLIFWILSFIRRVVRSKILKYRGWTFWWKNISMMLSDECCWDKLSRFARIIP